MYTIQKILQVVEGSWLQMSQPETPIVHILLDSRQVVFAKSALFFALPGVHHDGHDHLEQAFQQGVRNFIVSKNAPVSLPNANVIIVEDSLLALQKLVTFHRQQFDLTCIGITGSNGKTIVKELLFQLLRHQYKIIRSPKSYNSQVGVPLSVWQISESHDLGIFEAGISEPGEMEQLAPVIDCQTGIFTNIGPAHAEGFETEEQKIEEKLKLFKNCKTIVYCKDHQKIDTAIQSFSKEKTDQKIFTWSKKKAADLQITETQIDGSHTRITGIYKDEKIFLDIPFSDEVYLENISHCWAVALHLGLSQDYCYEHASSLEPVEMRLELKEGVNGCTIINDSYNADLGSLQIALQFLEQQRQGKKKTLILSDILQSGQSESALYEEVARLITEKKIDRLIGIGNSITAIDSFLPKGIERSFYNTTTTFLHQLSALPFQQEVILLKGARLFEFEKIANRLSQKVHRTVLEINLNALTHNLHVYSRYLEAGTKMMVMVKASAYGSGSVEVAKLLAFNKVDYLAVAYTDEGISLRKAGIELPIMVLNPEEQSMDQMVRYKLEPEVYNLSLLRSVITHSRKKETPIHLKLDTGMNRLGFNESDLTEVKHILNENPTLKIVSIFSHLAASEAAEHDSFTRSQIERYNKMYTSIIASLNYRPMQHLLNSGGIIRFPAQHMEMVRLGIGLYGIDSSRKIQDQLEVVMTLKASISQIKNVKTGETIGYSRKGVATKDIRTATISIGYADGLLRSAGNGKHLVNIRGQLAPIVGNVCMDMCMIDVTDIPDATEGDEVIIFGNQPTVSDLAKVMQSIPYEVFTGVSGRVKRVYVQE